MTNHLPPKIQLKVPSKEDWPAPPPRRGGFYRRDPTNVTVERKAGTCKGCQGGGFHDHIDYFDMVVCVNLDRRVDRWNKFTEKLGKVDWPFRQVERFRAIDGDVCPHPNGWKSGNGAWGCMQSHRQVLERALMEGHDQILVLEDDAFFVEGFGDSVRTFLKKVGPNWDCLMIGGQHMEEPDPVGDGSVVKCKNTQRTHGYALRGDAISSLYREWCTRMGHCDHIMGPFMGTRRTFAPKNFLIGQDEGKSDIRMSNDRMRLWSKPTEALEVIVLVSDRIAFEQEISEKGHAGYSRSSVTGCDVGIAELLVPGKEPNIGKLKAWWFPMVSWEAVSLGRRVVVWYPDIGYMSTWANAIAKALNGKVVYK